MIFNSFQDLPITPIDEKVPQLIDSFARGHDRYVSDWRERLDAIQQDFDRPVIWGAGSKGVTLTIIPQRAYVLFPTQIVNMVRGMRKYSTVFANTNEFGGITHISP